MKDFLKYAALRPNPVRGTIVFAISYSILKLLSDWLFHWVIPHKPIPPIWSMVITTGITTVIASLLVFLLFTLTNRQQRALEELNHELRNSLQVLSYLAHDSDPESRQRANAAIGSLSDSIRRVSQNLGIVSERKFKPPKSAR